MTEKEAYGLLGLRPGASDDAVKKAYRHITQKVHPDKGGNAALFCLVQAAYEFLTNKKRGTSQGSSGSANAEYADGAEEQRKREEEARRRQAEEQRRRSEEERRKRREEESRRAEEAKKKRDKEAKKKAAFEDYYERRRKAFSDWEIFKWSLVWGHFDRVDQKFEAERRELARRFGEAPRGRADETESWQTLQKKEQSLIHLALICIFTLLLASAEVLLLTEGEFNITYITNKDRNKLSALAILLLAAVAGILLSQIGFFISAQIHKEKSAFYYSGMPSGSDRVFCLMVIISIFISIIRFALSFISNENALEVLSIVAMRLVLVGALIIIGKSNLKYIHKQTIDINSNMFGCLVVINMCSIGIGLMISMSIPAVR